jgi:hypothetical protein
MDEGYHHEVNNLSLWTDYYSSKYRSMISCSWITVLGRFNIAYATSAVIKFNMLPREGNLKSLRRISSISRYFQRGE